MNDLGEKYVNEDAHICNQYLCQDVTVGFLPCFNKVFLRTQPCIIHIWLSLNKESSVDLVNKVELSAVLIDACNDISEHGDALSVLNCDWDCCDSSISESSNKCNAFGRL